MQKSLKIFFTQNSAMHAKNETALSCKAYYRNVAIVQ